MTKRLYPILIGFKRSPHKMSETQWRKAMNAMAAESGLQIAWKKRRTT